MARRALFLAICLLWLEVSFNSNPSTVAAFNLFLESKMFWSRFKQSKLLEATATKPMSLGLLFNTCLESVNTNVVPAGGF